MHPLIAYTNTIAGIGSIRNPVSLLVSQLYKTSSQIKYLKTWSVNAVIDNIMWRF